ncbi:MULTISPECIES: ABC transporter ATP-binding protein [unclassified Spirosoma]|uniref:ABC transporter ATP-binding protein n=1 Tax=unclassified Spirosoma TaxID=2621999 RepID=UPI0009666CA3|nr:MULTISPECIES: ABC transporter ATP-binding protein [unclassified Spirosoma]MBN8823215.1 ABC transporter ATP-binding protein [Spirosoma sp.]OJW72635.1 MAG: antibiotic ABC transporter ATP-binding protein [Spirosoma sp. 48-14]
MKTYSRLLSFARPLGRFLAPFVLTSLIASVFGVLNFTLLIPLLSILFEQVDAKRMQAFLNQPAPSITSSPTEAFNYYFAQVFQEYGKIGALQFVCGIIIVSVLLSNVFKYLSVRQLESFKARMVATLRETVFSRTIHLHLGFFSNERKGNLMSRITTDVQEVENSIANTLSAGSKEVFLLIGYIIALLSISVKLTLFAIIVIPISGGFIATLVRRMKRDAQEGQQRLSSLVSLLDETFGGMRVVKGFVAEGFILNKFRQENEGYRQAVRSLANRRELASPFSEVMGVAVVAGILLYGGSLVLSGQSDLTAAQFIAYIAIFSQVTRPAKDISNAFSGSQRGLASGERVLELIDTQSAVQDKPGAITLGTFSDRISVQSVSFAYNEDTPVLRDISFELTKGKTIALVGSSGGGKSTIADLIPRFYDPTSGNIRIDGVDLRDCTMASLRAQMGIVTQESILFNDTIFNNIAFGSKATEAQVMEAARIANAHEFIMAQPDGYQTVIGDRGGKLSGGQRQRISIARAILKNPPILILDEATSALDTESEKLVQEALTRLMANRTTLVIAHRLSTIQHADEILVVNQGRIVERGRHDELLSLDEGFYRKLSTMQNV